MEYVEISGKEDADRVAALQERARNECWDFGNVYTAPPETMRFWLDEEGESIAYMRMDSDDEGIHFF